MPWSQAYALYDGLEAWKRGEEGRTALYTNAWLVCSDVDVQYLEWVNVASR
jgi:hypothetical protein